MQLKFQYLEKIPKKLSLEITTISWPILSKSRPSQVGQIWRFLYLDTTQISATWRKSTKKHSLKIITISWRILGKSRLYDIHHTDIFQREISFALIYIRKSTDDICFWKIQTGGRQFRLEMKAAWPPTKHQSIKAPNTKNILLSRWSSQLSAPARWQLL